MSSAVMEKSVNRFAELHQLEPKNGGNGSKPRKSPEKGEEKGSRTGMGKVARRATAVLITMSVMASMIGIQFLFSRKTHDMFSVGQARSQGQVNAALLAATKDMEQVKREFSAVTKDAVIVSQHKIIDKWDGRQPLFTTVSYMVNRRKQEVDLYLHDLGLILTCVGVDGIITYKIQSKTELAFPDSHTRGNKKGKILKKEAGW